MQQYAGIYLLQIYSTCFGCPSHPSSGVHETVTTASGTGHSNSATISHQRGLINKNKQISAYFCIVLDLINIESRCTEP